MLSYRLSTQGSFPEPALTKAVLTTSLEHLLINKVTMVQSLDRCVPDI